nr:MAG TPA: hypothetical protein [Caudoviricetes sp.]
MCWLFILPESLLGFAIYLNLLLARGLTGKVENAVRCRPRAYLAGGLTG